MSYLALARKWRPNTFQQVVGQSHVLTALGNALSHNRLHHAYLFSGTRGVGKTSIGRLFAKGLNCETGITATPCGECDTCREIDQGRFVDLLEIDAASRTKVEDTRDLLDNVQYKPARGRFKVYLIDEVHMLSRHSFNALLKTLEEPPEYVKFLLATTDPQKLPVTILSRCLQFHLKPISVDDIHQQLEHILEQESISAEPRALGLLAHAADGSMRDALSLTDQAIALGNGHIEATLVRDMLGTIDTDQAIHLLEAISAKQAQLVVEKLAEFAQNGIEWDGLLQEMATQLHRIAMYQALPSSLDRAQPDAERIELLSRSLTPQDVQLYYQIALKGRNDFTLAPSGRVAMEMIALRMLAFRPAQVEQAHSFSAPVNSAAVSPAPTHSAIQPASQPATQVAGQPVSQPNAVQPQAVPSQGSPSLSASSQPALSQPSASQATAPAQYGAQTAYPQSGSASPAMNASDGQDTSSMTPPAYLNEGPHYGHSELPATGSQPQSTSMPASSAPSNSTPPASTQASPAAGLRHQLRSQRQQKQQGGSAQSGDGKKFNAASGQKESVLDRIAQKHSSSSPMLPTQTDDTAARDDEPYQWRPVNPVVETVSTELTPTEIKQALAHEKTPEMTARLVDESLQQNDWARLISEIETSKLVEQLALNSAFEQSGNTISLTLRAHQAHLNTDRAQSELLSALNQKLGQECVLSVEVGEGGETPLELRERLYQQYLQQAFHSLEQDPTVQFIQRRFSAQLDRDSVRPI